MSAERRDIVRLGAGSFATVYVWQGHSSVALKRVADPDRCHELLKEFEALKVIHSACGGGHNLFKIPIPIRHYEHYSDFRTALMGLEGDLEDVRNDAGLYVMERVWPVPPPFMNSIRKAFFPDSFKDNKQSFLSRLYLGKECADSKRFFNPLNFPLDVKRLAALQFSVSAAKIALDMGNMLAKIHFRARNDGRDIEFVLGGQALNPLEAPSFYCIDFNQVRTWTSPEDLVESFLANDPYYPRPGQPFWDEFSIGYTVEAAAVSEEDATVAKRVVSILNERASAQA